MPLWTATQFDRATLELTGAEEVYQAPTAAAALRHLTYTRQLTNGSPVKVGPTARVLYHGTYGWTLTPAK